MKRFITSIAIIVLLVSPALALAFDTKPGEIEIDQHGVGQSYVKITTIGTAVGVIRKASMEDANDMDKGWSQQDTTFCLEGSGFVVKDGYIVTAAHVVNPLEVGTMSDRHSVLVHPPVRIKSREIIITENFSLDAAKRGTPAEIFYLNVLYDIAILKYKPNDTLKPLPYKMAYTQIVDSYTGMYSALYEGIKVSMIARNRNENREWDVGYLVRYGSVTSGCIEEGVVSTEYLPEYSSNDFTMKLGIYPGDSGSPIFAFYDKKPVIVGIVRATNHIEGGFPWLTPCSDKPRAFGARIDLIKRVIDSLPAGQ